ncbi:chromosome condensation regulator RCC1 repeat protein (macronuclear) [Tetrahymena thermophila SB210]|uniref:Chromosome condensation regulator RCC1 repeat protein n=1 Tax=Tetrahymena thermophila (strain SB210) TaxID=312017 RepID=A4VDR2_TETTS|nr:chromosome condensation regulator RCC1 repeat protein [Tetrahymena thermophila SB210]EDK31655.2 chromosome condensation regulator RCC1 repeat protein [Tetrahymena thermophila SB210]|eukprot:XP_001471365.2 chromosome condensation regulator RCC1 repeat protein [Tetrahymena thermophila SB210]
MESERKEIEQSEEDQLSEYTEVFSWGSDEEGQMGLGENKRNSVFYYPRVCSFQIVIHQLACGLDHTAFVAKNGYLYTMGSNALGKLGIGQQSLQNSFQPQLVSALSKYKVMQVSCGHSHTCAIIDSGELFSWGDSSEGQLGINSNGSHYNPQLVNFSDLKGINTFVTDVSCGYYHTVAVLKNGQVCSFGSGKKGQLGTGNQNKQYKPFLLNSLSQIIKVKCGFYHTLFLDESGRVYSCGLNDEGQLGQGHNEGNISSPRLVLELEHSFIKKIFAGSHSAAITDANEIYFFGKSQLGQFLYPQLVRICQGDVNEISIGNHFGVAVTYDGKVYSWGINQQGQLGQGDSDVRIIPSLVEPLNEKKVISATCGENYVICLGQVMNSRLAKLASQKKMLKFQSPDNNNNSLINVDKEGKNEYPSSKSQSPSKNGMIKSQSQLILANKLDQQNEISKQYDEQDKLNSIYLPSGFQKKMKHSKSFYSPIESGIFSNQFSPEKNQQNGSLLIASQKDKIFNHLCLKNAQDKLQNNSSFHTGQKKQNPSESIAELSTKDGIKQSPSIQFDVKNNHVQDFSKQLPNQQFFQNMENIQDSINWEMQLQDRKGLKDQIQNLERQIQNKNEFIIKLQKENKELKEQIQNKNYSDSQLEKEQKLKQEKCDLLIENANLQKDNSQLLKVLQQQADQINELLQENKELNVKIKHQIQQNEIQNKQVNQKLVSYTEKIQDLERIYSDYDSLKNEIQIKDERIQILEDQTIYLKRQIEMLQKNQNHQRVFADPLSQYSSPKNQHHNNSQPLQIDISNYETVRNNYLDLKNEKKGMNETKRNLLKNVNENQSPYLNRSQLYNNKYKNLQLPSERDHLSKINKNSINSKRDSLQQLSINSPTHALNLQIQPQFQNLQSNMNKEKNDLNQNQFINPNQKRSILKNSPIKQANSGFDQNDQDYNCKPSVSFTDLEQISNTVTPSRSQHYTERQPNQSQLKKGKSCSFYQTNEFNPNSAQQKASQNVSINGGSGFFTPLNTKFQQSPQQYPKIAQNNFCIAPQTTQYSQASKQLDFLSQQKQPTYAASYADQEFQKSLSRTKQQLEQRLNEFSKKQLSQNLF